MKEILSSKHIKKEVITYKIFDSLNVVELKEEDKTISTSIQNNYDILLCEGVSLKTCWPFYVEDRETFIDLLKINHIADVFSTICKDRINKNLAKYLLNNEVKEENLFFFYSGGHLLFDSKGTPITYQYCFDYCSGLSSTKDSDTFDLLVEKMKEHPFFDKVNVFTIPYYNSDFGGHRGLEYCTTYIPQDLYEELFNKMKSKEFASVKMKDAICLNCSSDFDIYGEEINNLRKKLFEEKYG